MGASLLPFLNLPAMRPALFFLIACLFSTLHAPALASVVLTGTRVIYPAAASGQTLQLGNSDPRPYLVQMWLDAGNPDSTPELDSSDVPFVLSPPIFRMEPGSGQAVRLTFTGAQALPADRESLFYLNFTQLPALARDKQDTNTLVLVLKNRVKLFYRPHALSHPDTRRLACGLRFHVDAGRVQVENPAAFHASIRRAELLLDAERSVPLLDGEMLAPFSQQEWPLADAFVPPTGEARVRVILVNDYGADEPHDCAWR